LFASDGRVLVVTCQVLIDEGQQAVKIALLQAKGVEVIGVPCVDGRIDLETLLFVLAQDYCINDLMVEAGATLAGAFVQQQLFDELWWYGASCVMGNEARSGLIMSTPVAMSDVPRLTLIEQRQLGVDWRLRFKP